MLRAIPRYAWAATLARAVAAYGEAVLVSAGKGGYDDLNQRRIALAITMSLIFILPGVFLIPLFQGGLYTWDEFLTVDRTMSMVKTSDLFTVYTNCEPTWEKPPLHYYLGSVLISLGLSATLSLRLLSAAFAFGSLSLVAAMVGQLDKRSPWSPVVAVILCSSSAVFHRYSIQAVLETGYLFFILLSVYAVLLAEKNPPFWILWGIATGLGALQKSPVAFFVSMTVILSLGRFQEAWRSRWFRSGLLTSLMLSFSWPAVQAYRYGIETQFQMVKGWLSRLTIGLEGGDNRDFAINLEWIDWLYGDSPALWALVISTFLVASILRRLPHDRRLYALLVPALPVLFVLTFSGGPLYRRYLLTFTPLVIVVTTVVLVGLCRGVFWPLVIGLFVYLGSGVQAFQDIGDLVAHDYSDLTAAKVRVRELASFEHGTIFVASDEPKAAGYDAEGWGRPVFIPSPKRDLEYPAVYYLYGQQEWAFRFAKTWPGKAEQEMTVGRYAIYKLSPK